MRAVGTFLADPTAVPEPVVAVLARQLDVADPGVLVGYAKLPVRWKHTAEIRQRYGYTEFTAQPGHLSLLRWLYRQAWADELGPPALFRAAHRRMLAERVLLPGEQVLLRTVASVRERATRRLWRRLVRATPSWVIDRLAHADAVDDRRHQGPCHEAEEVGVEGALRLGGAASNHVHGAADDDGCRCRDAPEPYSKRHCSGPPIPIAPGQHGCSEQSVSERSARERQRDELDESGDGEDQGGHQRHLQDHDGAAHECSDDRYALVRARVKEV